MITIILWIIVVSGLVGVFRGIMLVLWSVFEVFRQLIFGTGPDLRDHEDSDWPRWN